MGTWDNGLSAGKPFRRARLIEGRRLRVNLHILRIDTRPEDPWVIQVALSRLNQEHLKIVVQVC